MPNGAKVHDTILPKNTRKENDHECHENLNSLLPALQQFFMTVCSIISSDAQNLSNSAQYIAFDNKTNLDPILI